MRYTPFTRAMVAVLTICTTLAPISPVFAVTVDATSEPISVESIKVTPESDSLTGEKDNIKLLDPDASASEEGTDARTFDSKELTIDSSEEEEKILSLTVGDTEKETEKSFVLDLPTGQDPNTADATVVEGEKDTVAVSTDDELTVEDETATLLDEVKEVVGDAVEAVDKTIDTVVDKVQEIITPDTTFPNGDDDDSGVQFDPIAKGEEVFSAVDATTDVAYLGNGRMQYKVYSAPRMLYFNRDGILVPRPAEWNLFSNTNGLELEESTDGYSYDVLFDPEEDGKGDIVAVKPGVVEIGTAATLYPKESLMRNEKEELADVTIFENVYDGIDVRFKDQTTSRSRSIILKDIPQGISKAENVVFWEEYQLPERAVVYYGDKETLQEKQILKEETVFIETQNNGRFSISDAIVFDATVQTEEDIEFSEKVYPVEQIAEKHGDTLRIGLVISGSYLLNKNTVYPVTIDPIYHACYTGDGAVNRLNCNIQDFYLRAANGNRQSNPYDNATLFVGKWFSNPNDYTRHAVMYFDTDFRNLPGDVTTAGLYMYYDNIGNGVDRYTDLEVTRIRYNWRAQALSDFDYPDVRGQLSTGNATERVDSQAMDEWIRFDARDTVDDWSRGFSNYGLLVQPDGLWSVGNDPPAGWDDRLLNFDSSGVGGRSPYLAMTLEQQEADLRGENARYEKREGSAGATVRPGDTIRLHVTVANRGEAATNVRGTLKYFWRQGSISYSENYRVQTETFNALGVDAIDNESYDFDIPIDAAPGTYYYSYFIDSANQIGESNENNNKGYVRVTVVDDREPDLTTENDRITKVAGSAGNDIRPGDTISMQVTVANRGEKNSGQSCVLYYYWHRNTVSYDNADRVSNETCQQLDPGATDAESRNLTIPVGTTPGTYYVSFFVDPNDDISESNENNNKDSVRVDVVAAPEVDLRPSQVTIENSRTFQSGDVIETRFQLLNNGNTSAQNAQYTVRLVNLDTNQTYDLENVQPNLPSPIAAGSSQWITSRGTVPNNIPLTGRYRTRVVLDHNNNIQESDEGNNDMMSLHAPTVERRDYCGGCGGGGGGGAAPPESDNLDDFDQDGFSDYEEQVAGTSPENADDKAPLFASNSTNYYAKQADQDAYNYGADPVNLRTGAFEFTQRDFTLSGRGVPIDFVRVYNSKVTDKDSRIGKGWHFSHNVYYYQDPATSNIQVYLGGSLASVFTTQDNGQTFTAPKGDNGTLFWDDGVLVYRTLDGIRYEFANQLTSQMGILAQIVDTNGNTTQFTYMTRRDIPLLTTIQDAAGRQVTLSYGAEDGDNWDRITQLQEHANGNNPRVITYSYDADGNLTQVQDNRTYNGVTEHITKQYGYTDNPFTEEFDPILTEYTDPRGTKLFNVYDAQGRVKTQREYNPRIDAGNPDGRIVWEISYAGGRADVPGSTACTTVTTHRNANDQENVTDVQCFNADGLKIFHEDGDGDTEAWTYDQYGMPAVYTDGRGNTKQYTHDVRRRMTQEVLADTTWHTTRDYVYENTFNRLTRKTERMNPVGDASDVTTRETVYTIDAANGNVTEIQYPLGLNETFQYDNFGNVTSFVDQHNNTTISVYDATGNYKTEQRRAVKLGDGTQGPVIEQFAYDVYGNITTYTDPAGEVFTYLYDTHNNVRQETNPAGDTKTFQYDVENNKTQEVNERGFVVNYVYDTDIEGSLIEVERQGENGQASLTTRYERDYVGNVLREINPRGNSVTYTYTGAGEVASVTTPENETTQYVYDTVGNITTETDARGDVTTYTYDARNKRTRARQTVNGVNIDTVYAYDGFDRQVSVTDPNGHATTYTYDLIDRVLSETNAAGDQTTFTYTIGQQEFRTRVTTPRGYVRDTFTDALGRVSRELNELGKETQYVYDTRGNLVRVVDRRDLNGDNSTHVTTYVYDDRSRRTSMTDAAGRTTTYTYDEVGNKTGVTDPSNRTTQYAYDAWNRQTQVTDPAGNVTQQVYDENGNLLETQLPDNTTIVSTYDNNDRRLTVQNGDGETTTFTYDAVGNLLSKQDALGRTTTFTYDEVSRRTQEANPVGTITAYTYDLAGNRTGMNMAGEVTTFAFDAANRVSTITHPGNKTESYTYDADGNVATFTDGEAVVTTYTYDHLGRMTSKVAGNPDYTTSYTYDNWDQVTRIVDRAVTKDFAYDVVGNLLTESHVFADHADNAQLITRAYNNTNQLTSLTDAGGRVFAYQYDNRGLLDRVVYGATTLADYTHNSLGQKTQVAYGNNVVTNYDYDNAQRVTDIHVQHGQTTYVRQQYTYDNNGNRTAMTETFIDENGVTQSRDINYGYDVLEQLTSVNYTDRGVGNNLTFAYDVKGNRTVANGPFGTVGYTYNEANELTGVSYNDGRLGALLAYDENGSLERETYRRLGNPLQVVDYTWDPHNRLQSIRYHDEAHVGYMRDLPDNILSFAYDSNGNRVKKQANTDVTYYMNSGLSVLSELAADLSVQKTIVQGVGPVAEVTGDGTIQYVHADALGSTIILTNAAGELASEYDYDVFGELLGMKGSAETGYLFTGQEFDGESGLYYYNARYYNPKTGRFISRDTYLGEDGDYLSRNRYIYVKNNPLKYVDPTGNISWGTIWEGVKSTAMGTLNTLWGATEIVAGVGIATAGTAATGGLGAAVTVTGGAVLTGMGANNVVAGTTQAAGGLKTIWNGLWDKEEVEDYTFNPAHKAIDAIAGEDSKAHLAYDVVDLVGGGAAVWKAPAIVNTLNKSASTIGATGGLGESVLKTSYLGKSQVPMTSIPGHTTPRYIDTLSLTQKAHESKVGYQSLTAFTKTQIAKDAALLQSGQINSAVWHFFRSPVTGKLGGSQPLMNALSQAGIQVKIHQTYMAGSQMVGLGAGLISKGVDVTGGMVDENKNTK